MPRHSPEKYLYDIQNGCEFLLQFTQGKTKEDYIDDRAFRSALERELQIIGEALMHLDHDFPDVADKITEHRNIIGFRHVLVHGYDSLNPATVWNIVETKLQALHEQVSDLLS